MIQKKNLATKKKKRFKQVKKLRKLKMGLFKELKKLKFKMKKIPNLIKNTND